MNEYIRGKSDFNEIVKNLKFYSSLIDSRPKQSTTIGISTVVNVYNVNKLKELDQFITKEFSQFELEKKFLSYPEFLRISCLPKEYKNIIKHAVQDYPELLQFLNKDDNNYFEEFIFYNNSVDKLTGHSLKDVNLELAEYIENYKSKKEISNQHVRKFYPVIDLRSSND